MTSTLRNFDSQPDQLVAGWNDVVAISAHCLDLKYQVLPMVVLDLENGEFLEFPGDGPEFATIMETLQSQFPGISASMLERVSSLSPGGEPEVFWRRS